MGIGTYNKAIGTVLKYNKTAAGIKTQYYVVNI